MNVDQVELVAEVIWKTRRKLLGHNGAWSDSWAEVDSFAKGDYRKEARAHLLEGADALRCHVEYQEPRPFAGVDPSQYKAAWSQPIAAEVKVTLTECIRLLEALDECARDRVLAYWADRQAQERYEDEKGAGQ